MNIWNFFQAEPHFPDVFLARMTDPFSVMQIDARQPKLLLLNIPYPYIIWLV